MTECARCGDCCDPVTLSADTVELIFTAKFGTPARGSQREWMRRHLRFRRFRGAYQLSRDVTLVPAVEFDCDYFDRASRACTAYDDRPDMCRRYPFYGREPKADSTMGGRCSFLADVPGVTMLPIVAVTSGGKDAAA